MPDLTYENQYPGQYVAGLDEVGRGCLAGPVVACAVVLKPNAQLPGVDDSKTLSAEKREALVDAIMDQSLSVAVGVAEVHEIDQFNILQATKLAMSRAIDRLTVRPQVLLIDGDKKQQLPDKTQPQVFITKGDHHSLSIAAASIIAKVVRDRLMAEMHLSYPEFNWAQNAGYGTKAHYDALSQFGYTPHHRRSFNPLKTQLSQGVAKPYLPAYERGKDT